MLISDLKQELKKYNTKELENIIVELYKRFPKNKKEDYNIDEFIKNVNVNNKIIKKEISFEELKNEILYFLQCVDNEYYAVPNRVISKKERSSWRFKVKRYYKELNNIPSNSSYGDITTFLLIEIFKRLSIGCSRLLFVNWDTFKALGVLQSEYYDIILKRILINGYSKDNLKKCIDLLNVNKDPNELSCSMFWVFISNLKLSDTKKISIEILDDKVKEMKLKLSDEKNFNSQYFLKEKVKDYVECITEIYFTLSEIKEGISYFNKNYIESDNEVKAYVLLCKFEELDLLNDWLEYYEKNKDKIKFRDSIKEKYNKLNGNN